MDWAGNHQTVSKDFVIIALSPAAIIKVINFAAR